MLVHVKSVSLELWEFVEAFVFYRYWIDGDLIHTTNLIDLPWMPGLLKSQKSPKFESINTVNIIDLSFSLFYGLMMYSLRPWQSHQIKYEPLHDGLQMGRDLRHYNPMPLSHIN